MKSKLADKFGYIIFILFFVAILPILFVYGGVMCIIRFYKYVSATVKNKVPEKYNF